MLNKIISVALVVMMSSFANAADSIDVNPDMGKPGQPARVPKDNEFKVCADQTIYHILIHQEKVLRTR